MIIAPIISAMMALDGRPSVSSGMKEVCAPALLADSGPATPSMAPLPNRLGSLRRPSSRACSSRTPPARRRRPAGCRGASPGRCRAAPAARRRGSPAGSARGRACCVLTGGARAASRCSRLRMISTMPNMPDDQGKEVDAVPDRRDAERVAREPAVDVGADETEQQADQHHPDRLDHRAVRQDHRRDQAEHHQREIVRRVELLGDARRAAGRTPR